MGVDYYTCDYCGKTFPDCCYYISCDCTRMWCSDVCAEKDGYENRENEEIEDGDDLISCNFCRGEDVVDSDLLKFMIKHFKTTRSKMIDLYYKKHK